MFPPARFLEDGRQHETDSGKACSPRGAGHVTFSRRARRPVRIGNPQSIGISDLHQPDFGDAVTVREGEVPVFWACGVTPQAVIMEAKPDIVITHSPGHMLITDIRNESLAVL
ncbi:DUF1445 domain-containing protein [Bacillus velezensis]|nr:DUF1445 domain-containing protein [Bacillus velezensis]